MTDNLDRIIGPPIFTLIFVAFAGLYARAMRRGRALSSLQRKMVVYATMFSLGMVYMIAWKNELAAIIGWQDAWIGTLMVWGFLLAAMAWLQNTRS